MQNRYQIVTQVRFPGVWGDEAAIAVSPDGRQVAVASGDVRLAMYAMPGLKLIKEFHFPVRRAVSQRIQQLIYSPDGKWLVAAQRSQPAPRLFNVANADEVSPNQGTGNVVRDLRFSPDGRNIAERQRQRHYMPLGHDHIERQTAAPDPGGLPCGRHSAVRWSIRPVF